MIGTFHVKTSYSMLESTIRLDALFEHAKQAGYEFVCTTDNKLHGLHKCLNLAKKHQIKYIAGLLCNTLINDVKLELVVYAKNTKGLRQLINLSTYLETENKIIEFEKLVSFSSNFIVATLGANSSFEQLLISDRPQAYFLANLCKESFANFYLGLSLQTFTQEMKIAPLVVALAEELKLKTLPMHQTAYLDCDDKEAYLALRQIQGNLTDSDINYLFYDAKGLLNEYADYRQVFENAKEVIQMISYEDFKHDFQMPKYPTKNDVPSELFLAALARLGLKKRLENDQSKALIYQERLDYELDVITKMGFCDYFLIVYDFIKYAKDNKILVGPGRGSAAGSLVSYCLGITEVDPIKYDLLFERFLNPQRISMPDIDLDFPDNRRDDVIEYVKNKYGLTRVVTITTFSTFALRSSIRDISKVLSIAPDRINSIVNRIVANKIDDSDEQTNKLLTMAKKIEGLPRQTGTHAAGIILSNDNLEDKIPLQTGPHQMYQSQYEASDLEQLGLLKIDFLGIKNLTIIDQVLKKINEPIVLSKLPLDDKNTYELLSSGFTSGIFQLESGGMRQAIRKVKPGHFEDLVALLALYRPGPMNHISDYVERKNNTQEYSIIKELEPILSPTYGIIIYQEQIMRIAATFAGYTLAEADLLRRGISKKDKDILEHEEANFVAKAKALGKSEMLARNIYSHIVKFADYGFNRSHSVAYSLVAYQMAYFKANYFKEFMSSLCSNVISNDNLLQEYFSEIRSNNVAFCKPDVNSAGSEFLIVDGKIMISLLMIKGIGFQIVEKLVNERAKGPFVSYDDFKVRVKDFLSDKNLISLIYASALDGFGYNKHTLYQNRSLEQVGLQQYIKDYQMPLYDEHSNEELNKLEKDCYGFNIFYHIADMYNEYRQSNNIKSILEQLDNKQLTFVAKIEKMRVIKTSKKELMAFLSVSDADTTLDLVVFPNAYSMYQELLKNKVLLFKVYKTNNYVVNEIKNIE